MRVARFNYRPAGEVAIRGGELISRAVRFPPSASNIGWSSRFES